MKTVGKRGIVTLAHLLFFALFFGAMPAGAYEVTNGVHHSIPLSEIVTSKVPKGGVPALTNPRFTTLDEADIFLLQDTLGIGFAYKGEKRFYPFSILLWHEVVNDTIQGEPILVTYNPLSGTAVVFDRKVDGAVLEFGVSSRFWKSNLLMYNKTADLADESLWSQILGEGVVGKYTGKKLTVLPYDVMPYNSWKSLYPDTKILSIRTPYGRNYADDPYQIGGYYTSWDVSFGAAFSTIAVMHPKQPVLGVRYAGKTKAYPMYALSKGVTHDDFNGNTIRIERKSYGDTRFFLVTKKGDIPLPFTRAYWFAWLNAHPTTEVYEP